MTNLFMVNDEVTTCYAGTITVDSDTREIIEIEATTDFSCSDNDNFGCYQRVEGINNGCASKSECSESKCCFEDGCNDPNRFLEFKFKNEKI
jgi:hypothetical protein